MNKTNRMNQINPSHPSRALSYEEACYTWLHRKQKLINPTELFAIQPD